MITLQSHHCTFPTKTHFTDAPQPTLLVDLNSLVQCGSLIEIPSLPDHHPQDRHFSSRCRRRPFAISDYATPHGLPDSTVVLSGAGLSVASGLADYRGVNGTYRVNKSYRPIYHNEFLASHPRGNGTGRGASWAGPHFTKQHLTQAITLASRLPPLHGLHDLPRRVSRDVFQHELARLNPAWDDFMKEAVASGALNTEVPHNARIKGLRTNPDGDVDLADAPYTTFRYPPCPSCLAEAPRLFRRDELLVETDDDGAWKAGSTAGILKPAVIMFGESIPRGSR
ncbi:unnamed protein product, partial [Parascedosporium putredinis]